MDSNGMIRTIQCLLIPIGLANICLHLEMLQMMFLAMVLCTSYQVISIPQCIAQYCRRELWKSSICWYFILECIICFRHSIDQASIMFGGSFDDLSMISLALSHYLCGIHNGSHLEVPFTCVMSFFLFISFQF